MWITGYQFGLTIGAIPVAVDWPLKFPGEVIDQTYDVTPQVSVPADITELTAEIAPSGSGELEATSLTFSGSTLTLRLESGQPTRVYTILFTAAMTDGEEIQWIIIQGVSRTLPTDTAPPPSDVGFGSPIIWSAAQSGAAWIVAAAGF